MRKGKAMTSVNRFRAEYRKTEFHLYLLAPLLRHLNLQSDNLAIAALAVEPNVQSLPVSSDHLAPCLRLRSINHSLERAAAPLISIHTAMIIHRILRKTGTLIETVVL